MPASSSIVTCGLPKTGGSLASALIACSHRDDGKVAAGLGVVEDLFNVARMA